jgi:hypothetical protein
MTWAVETSAGAGKALSKLDPAAARASLTFPCAKVARAANPRASGEAPTGWAIASVSVQPFLLGRRGAVHCAQRPVGSCALK